MTKRATVTITVEYDDDIPDEWIEFAAEDALVQMNEAVYRDPDDESGNETEFFSKTQKLTVLITNVAPGAPATAADEKYLSDKRGTFADGYTPENINDLLGGVTGADLYCVWDYVDQYGMGGDSQFVGQVEEVDGLRWYPVSDVLWAYLTGTDDAPDTLPEGTPLLGTEPHDEQDFKTKPFRITQARTLPPVIDGKNIAREHDCDLDHRRWNKR